MAFYEGGSTFSSDQGRPEDTPCWGIVVIAQKVGAAYDNVLCSGVPWYVFRWDLGFWMELDTIGFHDALLNSVQHISVVRPGRYTRTTDFTKMKEQAEEWVRG
jgi:hypothetical protein